MRLSLSPCGHLAYLLLFAAGCSKSEEGAQDNKAAAQGPTREQAEASGKNVRKICNAALNYESSHKEFPLRTLKAKDGQPGLCWRVALLPDLGEQALFDQFKLDEPWDSPANKPLVSKMPAAYKSPMAENARDGFTNYLAISTATSVLADEAPTQIKHITDGTSQTILVVEVNDDRAVPWTKPADYEPDTAQPIKGLGGLHPEGAFIVGMASSDVYFVKSSMDPAAFLGLCSRNGDELPDWEASKIKPEALNKSAIPTESK